MPTSSQYSPNDAYDLVATIAVGQTVSGEIDLSGVDPCGFFIPANFDGTALSIAASPASGGPYYAVQADGADLSFAVAAGKYCAVTNLAVMSGLRFIKLVAGTAQGGTDTLVTIAARPV